MTTLSDIDICSNALVRLGDDPINSFTESDAARSIGAIYPFVKLEVLTAYPWWITMVKSDLLSRDSTGPTTEYKYSFQLPPDMIGAPRKVFNSKGSTGGPQPHFKAFELYGRKLLSNSEVILIDYQKEVSETIMPFYLVELLTLATAAEAALSATDRQTLAEFFTIKAWGTPGENRRGGKFKTAALLDSQAQRPPRTTSFPLTAARQGG